MTRQRTTVPATAVECRGGIGRSKRKAPKEEGQSGADNRTVLFIMTLPPVLIRLVSNCLRPLAYHWLSLLVEFYIDFNVNLYYSL